MDQALEPVEAGIELAGRQAAAGRHPGRSEDTARGPGALWHRVEAEQVIDLLTAIATKLGNLGERVELAAAKPEPRL